MRPFSVSPNLDAKLTLLDANGNQLATSNPTSAMLTPDLATGLDASLTYNLLYTNYYYLSVSGSGNLDPLTTGYSGYASIGPYELQGQL